jgi:pimeloyl-ACP methyl ester carboxylesterase
MSVANCVLGLFLTGAAVLVVAPGYAQSQKVVMEEMMVPSSDPGIEIYVRNKHPADMTTFRPDRTVLYVHGATYPASTAFDLQLGGTSWMDYIAARGYDVYLLDLRGYGKSTRPKEINLLGWSWGTTLMATYTTQNASKVERLVLYAPVWIRTTASLVQTGPGPTPAYRSVKRDQALGRWLTGVPEDKKATLIPAGWFDQWADATWATDQEGATMNPPVLRAPNGVVQDGLEFFGAGKAYYDPSKITVPTLLIGAEWDKDAPPYMGQTLFPLLVNAPGKRLVQLPEGTHTIIMEKNRMMLFEAVQAFLDEAGRS